MWIVYTHLSFSKIPVRFWIIHCSLSLSPSSFIFVSIHHLLLDTCRVRFPSSFQYHKIPHQAKLSDIIMYKNKFFLCPSSLKWGKFHFYFIRSHFHSVSNGSIVHISHHKTNRKNMFHIKIHLDLCF